LLILGESFVFWNNQKTKEAELVRWMGGCKFNFEIPNIKNCAKARDRSLIVGRRYLECF
jgi:hypothetical protein